LGCLEVDAPDLRDHIDDRRRGRACAMRAAFGVVPAPGWVLVLMVRVGAADVAELPIPMNPERAKHVDLAPLYRVADRLSRDIPLPAAHDATSPSLFRSPPRRHALCSGAPFSGHR